MVSSSGVSWSGQWISMRSITSVLSRRRQPSVRSMMCSRVELRPVTAGVSS